MSREEIAAYVKPLTRDADLKTRVWALEACILAGDQSSVLPAIELMTEHLENGTNSSTSPVTGLRGPLERASIQPEHLSLLVDGLNSPSVKLRRFASLMLRVSHNKAALPDLQSALTDSDVKVRYNAVMGLAETLRDFEHAPCIDKFIENEAHYLDYWKNKGLQ